MKNQESIINYFYESEDGEDLYNIVPYDLSDIENDSSDEEDKNVD